MICYSYLIMLTQDHQGSEMSEQAIERIAARVIAALRDYLEAITAELSIPEKTDEQLTVAQVAQRLGVARSTVYAHWREWGGYKLGQGDKARIRFDRTALPIVKPAPVRRLPIDATPQPRRRRKKPHRLDLLKDAPRLVASPDQGA
jgi:transposase-like protein